MSKMDFESSSDDDAPPEEISVTASRQQGISQIKQIQDSLKRSKDEEKERRRQRNEMFRIQKANKLKDLSKRKLPEDVLAAVSAKSAKKSQIQDNNNPLNKSAGSDEEGSGSEHENDDDLSDSGVEDGHSSVEEFIPIGNTSGLALVTPGALSKRTQISAQKALDFKTNRLYNQPTIPRENTKQRRAKAEKRKAYMSK